MERGHSRSLAANNAIEVDGSSAMGSTIKLEASAFTCGLLGWVPFWHGTTPRVSVRGRVRPCGGSVHRRKRVCGVLLCHKLLQRVRQGHRFGVECGRQL